MCPLDLSRFPVGMGSKANSKILSVRQLEPAMHIGGANESAFPEGKNEGRKRLLEFGQRLEKLQELLYTEHKHKVLIILQAMDTGRKGQG